MRTQTTPELIAAMRADAPYLSIYALAEKYDVGEWIARKYCKGFLGQKRTGPQKTEQRKTQRVKYDLMSNLGMDYVKLRLKKGG